MSENEPGLGIALQEWRVVGARGDWEEVLRRAGKEERPRWHIEKLMLPIAAALIVILIAAPAFGLVSSVASLFKRDQGLQVVADLNGPKDGASVELLAPGAFVTVVGNKVVPRFRSREEGRIKFTRTGTLQWRLRDAGTTVQELRVVFRTTPSQTARTLCKPCSDRTSGAFAVTQAEAVGLFNGLASVLVATNAGPRHGVLSLRRTDQ